MARRPRFNLPGIPQHVIQRGNNREPCFFSEQDCHFYRDALQAASRKAGCAIHAYVLMTNHVHLLVTPVAVGGIPVMMQALGRRYVRYINDAYQRTGTLWEGRYKSCVVDNGRYLLTCYRYIEMNPVRARMVDAPDSYRWTSYRHNAVGQPDILVSEHESYCALGANREERCHAYRELFHHQLDSHEIDIIRVSANEELVYGSERFKDKIELKTRRRTRRGMAGRPRDADTR
jgi:putative transposase